MSRILMLVYNTIQNDARVIRAAEALSKDDHEITVISCNSDKGYINEAFKSIVFESEGNGSKLLLKFWLYCIKFIFRNSKEYEIIYFHDYFMPIIGRICNIFFKNKWVYDAHELLIQKKTHKWSLRERLFFWLEKKSIKQADLVIAANNERLRIINHIYRLSNSISIGNIAETSIAKENIKKDDYIVYQGILSEGRNVSTYITVLSYLPNNIKLKLIGGGDIEYYKTLAKELGLEGRVIFTGRIPYSELLKESAECKVGFVSYKLEGLNNYYCSPNKLYEYVQLGLYVIVSPQPFLKEVVKEFQIGEIWDERTQTISDLADIILKLFSRSDNNQEGFAAFVHKYNNHNEMSKLTSAINLLC